MPAPVSHMVTHSDMFTRVPARMKLAGLLHGLSDPACSGAARVYRKRLAAPCPGPHHRPGYAAGNPRHAPDRPCACRDEVGGHPHGCIHERVPSKGQE